MPLLLLWLLFRWRRHDTIYLCFFLLLLLLFRDWLAPTYDGHCQESAIAVAAVQIVHCSINTNMIVRAACVHGYKVLYNRWSRIEASIRAIEHIGKHVQIISHLSSVIGTEHTHHISELKATISPHRNTNTSSWKTKSAAMWTSFMLLAFLPRSLSTFHLIIQYHWPFVRSWAYMHTIHFK